jgi:hypothetical protein
MRRRGRERTRAKALEEQLEENKAQNRAGLAKVEKMKRTSARSRKSWKARGEEVEKKNRELEKP